MQSCGLTARDATHVVTRRRARQPQLPTVSTRKTATQTPSRRRTRARTAMSTVWDAAGDGNLSEVQQLVAADTSIDLNEFKNDSPTSAEKHTWTTPLYAACKIGCLDVATYLVKLGPERVDVNEGRKDDATPLYGACANGHLDVVKYLVGLGDCVDMNKASNSGATPLFMACQNGHLDVVQYLVGLIEIENFGDRVDMNKADNAGTTPLYMACQNGHLAVVQYLGGLGGRVDMKEACNDGATPLYGACSNGHLEVAQYLCGHPLTRVQMSNMARQLRKNVNTSRGVNPGQASNDGATPLYAWGDLCLCCGSF